MEALSAMQTAKEPFDAIILDAQMPEMDGYELAQRLRAEHAHLPPMLMLSSGAMRGDGQRCLDSGIAAYFSKPIATEELLGALCQVFERQTLATMPTPAHLLTRHTLRELQQTLNILLVEDHPTNQKLALSLLNKWGHQTTLAQHGQEALDLFSSASFDLVLMDIQMPVMGGIEATHRIRAFERQHQLLPTPIIAMTAAAMEGDRDACIAAGMDDYVSKPIKVKELLEKLLAVGATKDAST